jgi:2-polyprenyl-3-methyl-5-hydroxy-6-metoxy-1,4-benzoquinol methylase
MKDFGGDNYDLIILNDILQFFKNPEEIINTLSKLLHRSGRIIGSVSNHMELKNILSLIIHNEMTGDMIKMKKFQTSGLRCMNVFKLKKVFHHCGYKLENIEYGMSEKKFRLNNTFSGILSFVLSDVIYFNAIEKNIKIGVQPSKEG